MRLGAVAGVRGCDCAAMSGCPGCVQHLGCTEYNAVLHKRAAVAVLEATLASEREHAARVALQARARSQSRPGACCRRPGSGIGMHHWMYYCGREV